MQQHAFVISADIETGITIAESYIERELGFSVQANPDVVTLRHGLLSVEDARAIVDVAMQAPLRGEKKALIIAATRAYHEAQNALLKLFEEPPQETYLFLILPNVGGLLPTLKSRVHLLGASADSGTVQTQISAEAEAFVKASKEKRSVLIKKLASGKDEEERREHRDEAIAIVNGIERIAFVQKKNPEMSALLRDIAELRAYLYDRSAPVRMILEHISLVLPKGLK